MIFYVNYTGVTNFLKQSGFWPTLYMIKKTTHLAVDQDLIYKKFQDKHRMKENLRMNLMITQPRSVAKSVGCFQQRLFVCLFVNTLTSQRVNIG